MSMTLTLVTPMSTSSKVKIVEQVLEELVQNQASSNLNVSIFKGNTFKDVQNLAPCNLNISIFKGDDC